MAFSLSLPSWLAKALQGERPFRILKTAVKIVEKKNCVLEALSAGERSSSLTWFISSCITTLKQLRIKRLVKVYCGDQFLHTSLNTTVLQKQQNVDYLFLMSGK